MTLLLAQLQLQTLTALLIRAVSCSLFFCCMYFMANEMK